MISCFRDPIRKLQTKLRVRNYIISLEGSVDILCEEVDSCLLFDRHLQKVVHKASQMVTLLKKVKYLIDSDGMMILYKP